MWHWLLQQITRYTPYAFQTLVQVIKLTKTGPTTPVTHGQAFNFELRATFEAAGPFTAASIVDDLPVGLLPGAANATWTANNTAAGRLNGCECLQLDVHLAHIAAPLNSTHAWVSIRVFNRYVLACTSKEFQGSGCKHNHQPSGGAVVLPNMIVEVFESCIRLSVGDHCGNHA